MRPLTCLLLTTLALASGCSSEEAPKNELDGTYEGIYKLTSFTRNATSCDAPGASEFETEEARYTLVIREPVVDSFWIRAYGCDTLEKCRQMSYGLVNTFHSFFFAFQTSREGRLHGYLHRPGFFDKANMKCLGVALVESELTGVPGSSIAVEERVVLIGDVPMKDGAKCPSDEEITRSAEGRPCTELRTITAEFVEPISDTMREQ